MSNFVVFLQKLSSAFDTDSELLNQLRVNPNNRHCIRLECLSQVIEILNLLDRKRPQIGPTTRLDTNQAFILKAVECFPNGGFANSKTSREELFGQPNITSQLSLENVSFFMLAVCESSSNWRAQITSQYPPTNTPLQLLEDLPMPTI